MRFVILTWKKGKAECTPKIINVYSSKGVDKAIEEFERLAKTNKYYIVELGIIIRKRYTNISNSEEPRVMKIEGEI